MAERGPHTPHSKKFLRIGFLVLAASGYASTGFGFADTERQGDQQAGFSREADEFLPPPSNEELEFASTFLEEITISDGSEQLDQAVEILGREEANSLLAKKIVNEKSDNPRFYRNLAMILGGMSAGAAGIAGFVTTRNSKRARR